jgi:osmoprotectant transport system ATP-binding protein
MIEIDDVTKRYGNGEVVSHVSLTIPAGSIAVIVGTSGSGKTTLLRMINRLVEPSAGTIRIEGENTRSLPAHLLRRKIGYAIQGHGLFPHRTVAQNIATVPALLGWDRARIKRRVDELLTLFQLDPAVFGPRYPAALSGGQQQRVGVARALAAEPGVLLMDEPFGALDPVIRAKAQEDLRAIQRRFGTTVIMVTHDMEEAIYLGDRIAVMDGGRLLQYGAPAEILGAPATDFVESLLGAADRPFRLLSLLTVADLVEAGHSDGEPLALGATAREALAALIWSGREAAPVLDADGVLRGRITRTRLTDAARSPSLQAA